jgi:DNA-binding transcriptional regulator YiaG
MDNILSKEEFKAVREFLNESQKTFAERLGYSSGAVIISKKETGDRNITQQDTIILKPHYDAMRAEMESFKKSKTRKPA